VSNLDERIAKLEEKEAIRRQMIHLGDVCDVPYDPVPLAELWTEDGHLETGAAEFFGHKELIELFEDLAATFSVHYWTNDIIDVDTSLKRATGHWYGWETPIISGRSLPGAFTSDHRWEKVNDQWLWKSYRQVTHFICPVETGWVKGPRAVEQRASLGA
jgi:hypothetical protein